MKPSQTAPSLASPDSPRPPEAIPLRLEQRVAMSSLTTFGIGGLAAYLLRWRSVDELREGLRFASQRALPVWLLGGGSNVLVSDQGLKGLVLKAEGGGIRRLSGASGRIQVDAGVPFDDLVAWSVEQGLSGIECLSGIPGSVGAAPIQNIGAYGQELSDVLTSVQVLDLSNGHVQWLEASSCGLGYRSSLFKGMWRDRYVVTSIELELVPDGRCPLRYPDLERAFAGRSQDTAPTPAEVREVVLEVRRQKGMVYDPSAPDSHSAGSFFTNPVIAAQDLEVHKSTALRICPGRPPMPVYPAGPGKVKLSAAYLIEASGVVRGYSWGRAGVSSRHVLALVNRGGASALEVLALAEYIRTRVHQVWGIKLEAEVRGMGEMGWPG